MRVRGGLSGMTAGGGACSDGPSPACLRVEAGFFVIFRLIDFTIVALVKFFPLWLICHCCSIFGLRVWRVS